MPTSEALQAHQVASLLCLQSLAYTIKRVASK